MIKFDIEEAKKSGVYLGGTSGSGKTNTAFSLIDALMQQGIIVYVFDPSQAWQNKSNVPHYIVVDKLETFSFDQNQSLIFDISHLYVEDQRKLVAAFCKSIYMSQVNLPPEKRQWIFIFFEEAQIYLQQNSMRNRASAEVMRLITVGRNFKIRYGLITQFPSTIDKLPVKMTKQRYFGYTDEKNDIEYVKAFLGIDKAKELNTLKTGEFIYQYGKLLERLQFPEFKTQLQPQEIKPKQPESPKEAIQKYDQKEVVKGFVYIICFILLIMLLFWIFMNAPTHYTR